MSPRATGLQLLGHINPPLGTVQPLSAPVATPIRVKAGYPLTFRIAAVAADRVEIRLADANGKPVSMCDRYGSYILLGRDTGTRAATTVTMAFWLAPMTKRNSILSVEITTIRDGSPRETTVDTTMGHNLMVIVGSAYEDGSVNQTR